MPDIETIEFRATVIGGECYADDYTVIWRDLPIGRVRKNPGLPDHVNQWSWGCNVYGQRWRSSDSGWGPNLEDCKRQFNTAWAHIRSNLTDWDIRKAREMLRT